MRFFLACAVVGALMLLASPGSAQSAPIGGDTYQLAPYGQHAAGWSGADEAWFRRNRRFAAAGKVLTVVGVATILGGIISSRGGIFAVGMATQYTGQLIWAASELRGANEMRRRGVDVPRASSIVALVGAFVLSPLVWIGGPVQSARLRDAHDRVTLTGTPSTHFSSLGLGLRGDF